MCLEGSLLLSENTAGLKVPVIFHTTYCEIQSFQKVIRISPKLILFPLPLFFGQKFYR